MSALGPIEQITQQQGRVFVLSVKGFFRAEGRPMENDADAVFFVPAVRRSFSAGDRPGPWGREPGRSSPCC
jgi:hypothetical protein